MHRRTQSHANVLIVTEKTAQVESIHHGSEAAAGKMLKDKNVWGLLLLLLVVGVRTGVYVRTLHSQ